MPARPVAEGTTTLKLENLSGQEVASIQERKLSVREKTTIERDGRSLATVHKGLVGIRDRFAIDLDHGGDLKVHGNVVDDRRVGSSWPGPTGS